ncbi:DUF4345 domain-containing protein [Sphingomonas sp. A2-49]|uniref:DUF4345 domain-containing protein n=1 Tax=Sphingomonas sp. A2-49 TaxID=1391375 RepID=UPI0021CF3716|nr:DUF4345 domain-containing protein [Sphingomonas sp. A2-49]MCU6455992.1 DUF4345 domain-containing protein [Sphingomonas sp. A2-49]
MTPRGERRLLQAVVALACLVPLGIGGQGVLHGPGFLGRPPVIPTDLDSHFRYLSGIFLAVGVAFASCIGRIEARGERFRLLGTLVMAGGCARLVSLANVGAPSAGHLAGLAMELGGMPLLMLWQARLARRWRRRG